jgi:two-component system nitrogen regulation response regulator GlnG
MQKQTVFLFHEDPELSSLFESAFHKSNLPLETSSYKNHAPNSAAHSGSRVLLFEAGKEDGHEPLLGQTLKSDLKKTMIIIGPAKFLKKSVHHIEGLSQTLIHEGHDDGKGLAKEIYMEDFLESRLKALIKKGPTAKKSRLYDTLLKEFERPLITLALKETNGNQIQAADILGLNRNTLRKKIQELKISVKSIKTPPEP